jgi:hypothetical protein
MKALFTINRFSFSKTGNVICVDCSFGKTLIDKKEFQDWVDRDEKRCGQTWDEYYASGFAEHDIYQYIVVRHSKDIFGDIKGDIDTITQATLP